MFSKNIFNIKIKFKSTSKSSLYAYLKFLKNILNKKDLPFFKVYCLPKKKFRISLLKSPHVNKKAKEHFQVIFYRFEILIHNSNICILNFLFLNKPKSISSRVSVRRVV